MSEYDRENGITRDEAFRRNIFWTLLIGMFAWPLLPFIYLFNHGQVIKKDKVEEEKQIKRELVFEIDELWYKDQVIDVFREQHIRAIDFIIEILSKPMQMPSNDLIIYEDWQYKPEETFKHAPYKTLHDFFQNCTEEDINTAEWLGVRFALGCRYGYISEFDNKQKYRGDKGIHGFVYGERENVRSFFYLLQEGEKEAMLNCLGELLYELDYIGECYRLGTQVDLTRIKRLAVEYSTLDMSLEGHNRYKLIYFDYNELNDFFTNRLDYGIIVRGLEWGDRGYTEESVYRKYWEVWGGSEINFRNTDYFVFRDKIPFIKNKDNVKSYEAKDYECLVEYLNRGYPRPFHLDIMKDFNEEEVRKTMENKIADFKLRQCN